MLIHVDEGKGQKDRKVMLSPDLRDLLAGVLVRGAARGLAVSGQAQDQSGHVEAIGPCVQLGQTSGWYFKTSNAAYPAA